MNQERFEFGKNWNQYIEKNFSQERVDISQKHMLDFLGLSSLEGRSFLDIGCGSGLHSLAAWQAGASPIFSFDYDINSVSTTMALHGRAECPPQWHVNQGSILDDEYLSSIGHADIVYSWGVLHHTGDVWTALGNAASKVANNGLLYVALYSSDAHIDPTPEFWLATKKKYLAATSAGKRQMERWYVWNFSLNRKLYNIPRLLKQIVAYKLSRGMDYMTDVRDWLGGWPMEFCKDQDVIDFVTGKYSCKLVKIKTGEANTEFLFQKVAA